MKLSAPKQITFFLAVALGAIGAITWPTGLIGDPGAIFWITFSGLAILILGNLVEKL
jgi:hypothetical protein